TTDLDSLRVRAEPAFGRVGSFLRHEAAIDDDDVARAGRWRKDPIAGPGSTSAHGRPRRVNERVLAWRENRREFHSPELVIGRIEARPTLRSGQIDGGRGETLLQPLDQCFLPGLAVQLPGAEAHKHRESRQHEKNRDRNAVAPCKALW